MKLESHCSQAAGREVNQASDDIPRTVSVTWLSPLCHGAVVRGQQTDGSGCQECQVAAMWRRIFFAALRSAPNPQIRKFFRRAVKHCIDGALPRPLIEGLKCHAAATEKLFMFTGKRRQA